jgi:Glycosyl transferase family 2
MDNRQFGPVTIIIPAWLRDAQDITWLEEAMSSAADQTLPCDVVIVENGSSFLPDIEGHHVSIIHSEKGLSRARNAGIRWAKTEFFFPLDANDWLPETAIQTAVRKMPATGFLYGATMLFNGARGSGDQHLYEAKPYDFSEVMKMVYFPNGALQRKTDWEKIGGYREDLPYLEDWDYWITAGEKGICGTAIPDLLYWYRQHGGIVQTYNKTQGWEETKRLIQSYHKDVYRGVFPPMCCGNRNIPPETPYVAPSSESLVPGADGMILIEYVGGNSGNMTWYGAATNTRYVAGGVTKRIYVDAADAVTGRRDALGLLELTDYGRPVFARVS